MNVAFQATAEAEIREMLGRWQEAVRARDMERILTHYAPDVVAFDAIAQLQFKGVDAYGRHWQDCLAQCAGPMVFEMDDVHVAAGGDVAFCHSLLRCGGTGEDGVEKVGWMRMTVGFRRIDGEWRVVHKHYSAPFDVETEKVLWLEPTTA